MQDGSGEDQLVKTAAEVNGHLCLISGVGNAKYASTIRPDSATPSTPKAGSEGVFAHPAEQDSDILPRSPEMRFETAPIPSRAILGSTVPISKESNPTSTIQSLRLSDTRLSSPINEVSYLCRTSMVSNTITCVERAARPVYKQNASRIRWFGFLDFARLLRSTNIYEFC